jgi:hypothetical protein
MSATLRFLSNAFVLPNSRQQDAENREASKCCMILRVTTWMLLKARAVSINVSKGM